MTIQLNMNALEAALIAAAKNDVRHYLNGVHVEPLTDKVNVISTDGHMLFAGTYHAPGSEPGEPFTLDRTSLEALLKTWRASKIEDAAIVERDRLRATVAFGDNLQTINLIDERFPQWRAVIPGVQLQHAPADESPQVNPSLLVRARQALGALTGQRTAKQAERVAIRTWYGNQANSALTITRDESEPTGLVIVMPLNQTGVAGKHVPTIPNLEATE